MDPLFPTTVVNLTLAPKDSANMKIFLDDLSLYPKLAETLFDETLGVALAIETGPDVTIDCVPDPTTRRCRLLIEWRFDFEIVLDRSVFTSTAANLRDGVYGHEQQHVDSYIKSLSDIVEAVNSSTPALYSDHDDCKASKAAVLRVLKEEWEKASKAEAAHESPGSPPAGKPVPPKGGGEGPKQSSGFPSDGGRRLLNQFR